MVDPARRPAPSVYDQDFARWTAEQADLLKARRPAGLDWENLAEEIETLGRSERSEIRSRLAVLILHLLKWQFQPGKRKAGWRASIIEARDQLGELLRASPSLKTYPGQVIRKQYEIARLRAADESGLDVTMFPEECPYTVAQLLDEGFYPGKEL